jgi:hypothetical protein
MSVFEFAPIDESVELKKFNGINVPFPEQPTSLHFLLTRHSFATDLPDNFGDYLQDADALILEGANWHPEIQDMLNAISYGDEKAQKDYQAMNTSQLGDRAGFPNRVAHEVLGTGKPVRFCDIPFTRKNIEKAQKLFLAVSGEEMQSFSVFTAISRKYYQNYIKEGLFERDKHILRNVYPILRSAVGEGVSPARGLFLIGGTHRSIPFALRKKIAAGGLDHQISETYYGEDGMDYAASVYVKFLQGQPIEEADFFRSFLDKDRGASPEYREEVFTAPDERIVEMMHEQFASMVAGAVI